MGGVKSVKNESLIGKFFKETLPSIARKIIAFLQSIGARIASLKGKFAANRTKADPSIYRLLTAITAYMRKAIGTYTDLKGMGDKTQNIDKEWASNKNQELNESINNIQMVIDDIKGYYFSPSVGKTISESTASNARTAINSWTKWISLIEKTVNSIKIKPGQNDPRYGFIGTIQRGFSIIHQSAALIGQVANSVEVKKEQDIRSDKELEDEIKLMESMKKFRHSTGNLKEKSEYLRLIEQENKKLNEGVEAGDREKVSQAYERLRELAKAIQESNERHDREVDEEIQRTAQAMRERHSKTGKAIGQSLTTISKNERKMNQTQTELDAKFDEIEKRLGILHNF